MCPPPALSPLPPTQPPMLRRSRLGGEVRAFYRKTLRVVFQLEERHQRIWYDYLRLKFGESADVRDDRKVKRLLAAGHEEVDWVVSVLERKNKPVGGK